MRRQFSVVHFNMGVVSFSTQALISQAPIRPLLKATGDLQDQSAATWGEFRGRKQADS